MFGEFIVPSYDPNQKCASQQNNNTLAIIKSIDFSPPKVVTASWKTNLVVVFNKLSNKLDNASGNANLFIYPCQVARKK
jgi:hypothetical protein